MDIETSQTSRYESSTGYYASHEGITAGLLGCLGIDPIEPRHTNKKRAAWNRRQGELGKDTAAKQDDERHERGPSLVDPEAALDDLALGGEDFRNGPLRTDTSIV